MNRENFLGILGLGLLAVAENAMREPDPIPKIWEPVPSYYDPPANKIQIVYQNIYNQVPNHNSKDIRVDSLQEIECELLRYEMKGYSVASKGRWIRRGTYHVKLRRNDGKPKNLYFHV